MTTNEKPVDEVVGADEVVEDIEGSPDAAKMEGALLREAVAWVMDNSIESDTGKCTFCGWEAISTERENTSLRMHIRAKHPTNAAFAYQFKDLNALATYMEVGKAKDETTAMDVLEKQLFGTPKVGKSYDRYDSLYLPEETERKVKGSGGTTRWVTKEKFTRYRDMGLQVLQRPKDVSMPNQGSTEDTSMRSGEMVAMMVPKEVHERRREIEKRKIDGALVSRQEEAHKGLTGTPKAVYDLALKRGLPKDAAMKMANQAEKSGLSIQQSNRLEA